jgi:predicted ATPase
MEEKMINNLHLKYFKCFRDNDIMFSPLTLLTGLNSSGKSSVMQAIRIATNNKLVDGYGDCISELGTEAEIVLELNSNTYTTRIKRGAGGIISSDFITNQESSIQYIAADRAGPANYLPFDSNSFEVGEKGENVLSYLTRFSDGGVTVPEGLRREGYELYSGIKEQVVAWLGMICPGLRFDYSIVPNADIVFSTFSGFRAKDVGFGLSYTLPIIVSVLGNSIIKNVDPNRTRILLIENPEAHLHPKGQTEMGVFLARAAFCGLQVVVETHSDHLLNGVRIAIKNKQVEHTSAIVHFFEYDTKEELSRHYPIFIDGDGVLDEWPNGFFDENEKNLFRLM